jgi:hypothetical protein
VAAVLDTLTGVSPRCGQVTVLAVDGGAAAGKSSLAAALDPRVVDTVHTDDLLDGWAGQFTFWPRLRDEVLQPLCRGRPGRYRRYDWIKGAFADEVMLTPPDVLLVEGVSAIQACGPYLALGVLITVDRAERERRWRERDLTMLLPTAGSDPTGPAGPASPSDSVAHTPLPAEWTAWLAAEDEYFGTWRPGEDVPIVRC